MWCKHTGPCDIKRPLMHRFPYSHKLRMTPIVNYWLSDMLKGIIVQHPGNVVYLGSMCNDGGKSKNNY